MSDRRNEVLDALLKEREPHIFVIWREFKKNKPALAGGIVMIIILCFAFGASLILPADRAIEQDIYGKFTSPNAEHIFGTDFLGRDVFARILHGAHVSLTMGIIPSVTSLLIGIILGGTAVYSGGYVETVIMRFCDFASCIPSILLALALVAALGPGLSNVMVAVTIASIPDLTRYVRSVILNIVGLEYIDAARACGVSGPVIVLRHVLPNAAGPLILSVVSNIAGMIMIGAGLSFLGLGIQPPYPEWGSMLAEGQNYFTRAPYLMVAPGLAIFISVLSFNLVGDGLRDALDPKLR